MGQETIGKRNPEGIYDIEKYFGQAYKILKHREDAEDAVQSALLLFLTYKESLNSDNPERTIRWLLKQQCVKIYYQRSTIIRHQDGVRKLTKDADKLDTPGTVLRYEDFSELNRSMLEGVRCDYNDGEFLHDYKVIKDSLFADTFLGIPFQERALNVTVDKINQNNREYIRLRKDGTVFKKIRV